jgi:hypothetical protein
LEKVRSTTTFSRWASSRPRTASASVTNSTYASSTTTATWSGSSSISAATSACARVVPVGLFGVHRSTARVAGVTAARIAATSCRAPAVSGTGTPVAPVSRTAMGYASKLRQA